MDLRTQAEAELAPSALTGLTARRLHISVLGGDMESLPLELEAIYRYMIETCGGSIAEAIGVLGGADAVPALVHCSAGKDRTGIVIALMLAVLGRSRRGHRGRLRTECSLPGPGSDARDRPLAGQHWPGRRR